jgi:spermidine synthase
MINKFLLYFLIFIASAFVMILEIIGAKFLTPILGGSQTVWISQILITLLSLSFGGYFSSLNFFKEKSLFRCAVILLVSSLYFLLILINFQSISSSLLEINTTTLSIYLSLLLYLIPLTSLGVCFPLITLKLMKEHNIALGKISFISTLGSVLGTTLTYVIVIYWTNDYILITIGFLMAIYSSLLIAKSGNMNKKVYEKIGITFLGLLISSIFYNNFSQVHPKYTELKRVNSHFGEISVLETDTEFIVTNDRLSQNLFNKFTKKSSSLYNYFLMDAPFLYNRNIKSALVLGLGAGVVSKELLERGLSVDSVEINEQMIKIAKEDFSFKGNVFLGDARVFIKKGNKKYDLIVLDAFLVDSVPKYLLTQEFFKDINKKLNKDGILVINSFGKSEPLDYVSESIFKTLNSVFSDIQIFSLNEWNVFFIASNTQLIATNLTFNQPEAIKIKFSQLLKSKIKSNDHGQIIKDNDSSIEVLADDLGSIYRKKHSL